MGLIRYTTRRLLQAVPVLVGVVAITFALVNAAPGNPVEIMLGPSPSQGQVEAIRARYGLNQPLHVRFWNYLVGVVQLDLGRSIYYDAPVTRKIAERLPKTLLLIASSFTFAILAAVPLGVLSAKRRNQPTDHVTRVVSLVGVSTPSFWIGLMLILLFAYQRGRHRKVDTPVSGEWQLEHERHNPAESSFVRRAIQTRGYGAVGVVRAS